jgi:hypothetical protein
VTVSWSRTSILAMLHLLHRIRANKGPDEAVFVAYGRKPNLNDEEILEKLLAPGSLRSALGMLRKIGQVKKVTVTWDVTVT